MDFKERVYKLTMALGINKTQLQQEIGASNAYFANVNKVSGKVAAQIKAKYPQVNIEWLNEGIGNMFIVDNSKKEYTCTVPLLPIKATAGSLSEFEIQINNYDCERIISPIMDASLAITVTGESMSPEYPNGCTVLLKRIYDNLFIEWGRTYVLDTKNGIVVKNIFPCKDDPMKITCHSINPNFPDFNINKEDIYGWYRVLMQISLK